MLLAMLAAAVAWESPTQGRQLSTTYQVRPEDAMETDVDPWTPCDVPSSDGEFTAPGGYKYNRGYCRLSCTTRWAHVPHELECEMLPLDELFDLSHSRGIEIFGKLSADSFSKVNSGPSDPNDPDVA